MMFFIFLKKLRKMKFKFNLNILTLIYSNFYNYLDYNRYLRITFIILIFNNYYNLLKIYNY